MKVVAIWKPERNGQAAPPSPEQMAEMGAFVEEAMKAGVLLDTAGVMGDGLSLKIRRAGSTTTVLDGPFAEAKEVVGGYAIMNVRSKEELIAWSRRFVEIAGDGESEIHELFEPPS
jgi:hypothetical protein